MAYQYRKDQDTLGKEGCDEDPMSILLHQLMGVGSKKPRKLAGFNIFSKECYDKDIRPKLNAWLKLNPTAQKDVPKVRSKLTRDVFNSLDAENPQDQQNCISRLGTFVEPILELISAATGMQASFIAGGPEPVDGGCLNIIRCVFWALSTCRMSFN
ncbi:hypothetical protein M405DRAFT_869522 [Rhizopogon salebrosus TDB-379]|nr:hypothetical protein M405DRAFT_869522 [Rhizopogon salebrosus TDB-379]